MAESIERCKKCILPASYPGITFDEEGTCNLCQDYKKNSVPSEGELKNKLDRIIQSFKGKGKYDAVVGLSGGKDSSYVAYYLKKEYGLKILGLNLDNGYCSDYARINLNALSNNLELDLVTIKPNHTFMKKLYAHFLRSHGEFCSVCNNMGYLLSASFCWNQRHSLGFSPLAVGGWSKKYEYQPGISVTSMQYFFNNLTPELTEELLAQTFIEADVVRSYMKLHDPRQAKIDTEEQKGAAQLLKLIQLPDYISWDMNDIPKILTEAFGWKQPSQGHASHFDCTVFPIKEYLKYKKYGLSQETIKNSVMIREDLMTRAEALEKMKLDQTDEPPVLATFLNELRMTKDQINFQGEWSR